MCIGVIIFSAALSCTIWIRVYSRVNVPYEGVHGIIWVLYMNVQGLMQVVERKSFVCCA